MFEGIKPINTPKHGFKNSKEAKDWAKSNIVGIYKNNDTGEDIRISILAIGKYLSKKAVEQSISIDAHLSALKQMPSLIKEIYKNPADKRQGSISPLSYIESLTPLTDGKIPNPDFLSAAASLPAPESCQPVAKKGQRIFLTAKIQPIFNLQKIFEKNIVKSIPRNK